MTNAPQFLADHKRCRRCAKVICASVRLHFLDALLRARYRGTHVIPCHASFGRGDEMGGFEHGSTIIVFAPKGFALCEGIGEGSRIRMGEGLLRLPA